MIKVAIVGASGYAGGELVRLLSAHEHACLTHLFVSEQSADRNMAISDLYGSLCGRCELKLEPLSVESATSYSKDDFEVVFLATEHKVSHDLAPIFIDKGIVVIDLSGAFRLSSLETIKKFYGFELMPRQQELLQERVYALVDLVAKEDIENARLISMPGCYTTTSELALKPLVQADLLDDSMPAVINAVSGVSGAGRKAKLNTSFCEVSLNAYGLFNHRHQPEIEEYAGCKVIFNPHLASFKRGILATITVRLKEGTTQAKVQSAYQACYGSYNKADSLNTKQAYALANLVRVKSTIVKLDDVVNTPFYDLSYSIDESASYMVVTAALDNLLKGAASQAVEAFNIHFKLAQTCGLV